MGLRIENDELYYEEEFLGAFDESYGEEVKVIDYTEDDFPLPEEVLELKEDELLDNVIIHTKRYTVQKINNKASVELFENYELEYWEFNLSPNKFYRKLSSLIVKERGRVQFIDGGIDVFLFKELKTDNVLDSIRYLEAQLDNYINKLFKENKIENSINFSSEHLTAGSSILQYFGKLLQEKYPNEKVSVSIKQEGLKVTMLIETPDGKKEEVEEYLNQYGLVITNQISPEEFTSNPIQLVELKQELRDAQNKIAFQQELIALKDSTYNQRILSLEDEVKFLREEFSNALLSNKENIAKLLESLNLKDKLIRKLTKSIEKKDEEKTKQLLLELKENDSKGYVSLKEYIDNAIVGNIQNAPAWIEYISKII